MSGSLLRNLLLFGRILRKLGLDVNAGRMMDLVAALQIISIGRRSDFYYAARGLLVHRREDIAPFDEAFEFFWRSRGRELTSLDLRALGERRRYRRPQIVPPPLQDYTSYETAVLARGAAPDAAQAFIKLMTSAPARKTWEAAALEAYPYR